MLIEMYSQFYILNVNTNFVVLYRIPLTSSDAHTVAIYGRLRGIYMPHNFRCMNIRHFRDTRTYPRCKYSNKRMMDTCTQKTVKPGSNVVYI